MADDPIAIALPPPEAPPATTGQRLARAISEGELSTVFELLVDVGRVDGRALHQVATMTETLERTLPIIEEIRDERRRHREAEEERLRLERERHALAVKAHADGGWFARWWTANITKENLAVLLKVALVLAGAVGLLAAGWAAGKGVDVSGWVP